jgi:hypothetical protein
MTTKREGDVLMDVHLNVINSVEADGSNEAYSHLVEGDKHVRKLIHISEVFDFEDNEG